MEVSEAQYRQIKACLPRQWENVRISNRQALNAILHVAEHGCKWQGLPKPFRRWHMISIRHEPLSQGRGLIVSLNGFNRSEL
jgi:transposase